MQSAKAWVLEFVSKNFVMLALFTSVFAWAYLPTLIRLVSTWNREPDYGHGYLVPVLALAFLYIRRDLMPKASDPALVPGLALIGFSLLLRVAGALAFVDAIDAWSMLFWLAGVVWMFAGRSMMVWALPSIGFLFFMIPLPYRAERMLSLQLQGIATKLRLLDSAVYWTARNCRKETRFFLTTPTWVSQRPAPACEFSWEVLPSPSPT